MAQDMVSKAQVAKSESEVVATVMSIRDIEGTISVNDSQLDQILSPILHSLDRATLALEGLKTPEMQRRWFEMMEVSLQEELVGSYDRLMYDGPDSIRDLVAEHVEKTHEEDVLSRLFRKVRPICREEPGLFIWLTRRLLDSPENTAREGLARPAVVEQLVGLHEVLAYRARTSRKDQSAVLRAHMSNIRQTLKRASFKQLREILKECDAPTARSLWKTAEGAAAIEDRIRKEIIGYIMAHFPSIASTREGVQQEEEAGASLPVRLLCLEESYQNKKKHLDHLMKVEIPENTKEVETARLLGDLRENAEYHAAKDKQRILLSLNAQLQEEIGSASIVPAEMFSGDSVGFGSAVRIQQDGGERDLVVLGPWESRPEANIISYESPLGRALWGRNVGDAITMNLGDKTVPVEIVSIEPLAEIPSGVSD
jgi:transcription elongation factor GreA